MLTVWEPTSRAESEGTRLCAGESTEESYEFAVAGSDT